ncbi:MAG: hypothetical protein Fur0024_1500 [Patescibacteria group bacterium]
MVSKEPERLKFLEDKTEKTEEETKELEFLKNFPTQKVYHISNGTCEKPEGFPTEENSKTLNNFDSVLGSLGVSPSDLFFTNGIIWVEGPSDAIYIEKWLEMYQLETFREVKFKKGLDYQYMWYGGSLLKFINIDGFSFETEKEKKQLSDLFKINRNFFVVLDNDKNKPLGSKGYDKDFQNAKDYLRNTFNGKTWYEENDKIWTIEKYIPNDVKFFKTDKGTFSQTETIFVENDLNSTYSKSKGQNAIIFVNLWDKRYLKFSDFCSTDDDLYKKIQALYNTIASWNSKN